MPERKKKTRINKKIIIITRPSSSRAFVEYSLSEDGGRRTSAVASRSRRKSAPTKGTNQRMEISMRAACGPLQNKTFTAKLCRAPRVLLARKKGADARAHSIITGCKNPRQVHVCQAGHVKRRLMDTAAERKSNGNGKENLGIRPKLRRKTALARLK